ncbi:MAG: lycopene cyclase domain-containing protein [Chloroflexota bacterium]|nr:lycopene cyclase domain-containing protein [Chloroflexota bacterium]
MPNENLTYLLLELGWSLPIIGLLSIRGWRMLWRARKALLVAGLVPTLFLCIADSLALHQGIWLLNSQKITGLYLANLPIEEVIFFALTNLIIVQAMLLLFALQSQRVSQTKSSQNLASNANKQEL